MVQQLKKLISLFHKDHSNKSVVTFEAIDNAYLMAKPIIKLTVTKQKRGRPAKNSTNKKAKKTWAFFLKISWFSFLVSYHWFGKFFTNDMIFF